MSRILFACLAFVFSALGAAAFSGLGAAAFNASTVAAQEQTDQPIVVATRLIKPFVFEENGRLTGFSVELWEEITKQLNMQTVMVPQPTVRDQLNAVKNGQAAIGIAAISITAEREQEVDFSQPMFDGGLQILISAQGSKGNGLSALLGAFFSPTVIPVIGFMLLLILIPAHLVWVVERRHPTGMLDNKAYFPGIFEACWWAASTLATQADTMPRAAMARVIAIVWMFAGVVFVATFTAAVTSTMTLEQLKGDIDGPEDLPGKHVASVRGSTSIEYLKRQNADVVEFANIDEAYKALEDKKVDAVVYDAAVLLYYASREGSGKVQMVGSIFRKENYGIAFPTGSPYRKQVNEALLQIKESGTYNRLYDKWFGKDGKA